MDVPQTLFYPTPPSAGFVQLHAGAGSLVVPLLLTTALVSVPCLFWEMFLSLLPLASGSYLVLSLSLIQAAALWLHTMLHNLNLFKYDYMYLCLHMMCDVGIGTWDTKARMCGVRGQLLVHSVLPPSCEFQGLNSGPPGFTHWAILPAKHIFSLFLTLENGHFCFREWPYLSNIKYYHHCSISGANIRLLLFQH